MINTIKIYTEKRQVYRERKILGISGENGYETLKFELDDYIDGQGILEIEKQDVEGNTQKYFIELEKGDNCYLLEVKNSLLDVEGDVTMQLVIRKENKEVFKSSTFTMEVSKAINATETIPEQYKTLLDELDSKIEKVDTKLSELTELEEQVIKAEQTRNQAEIERETKTTQAIENIQDLTEEYNTNAQTKMAEFDTNAEDRTNLFNENAKSKQDDFDANVTTKTDEFNKNVTDKEAEINTLAEEKIAEYNENAETKLTEFNENAESYEKRIAELETENSELVGQMPFKTTGIAESIHVEDSAKYSRNKLDVFGNLEQKKRNGYNIVDFANPTIVREQTSYTFKDDVLTIEQIYGAYQGIVYDILEIIKKNPGKTLYFKCSEVDFANASKPTVQIRHVNNGVQTYKSLFNETLVASEYTILSDVSGITEFEIQILVNNTATTGVHSMSISKPMLTFNSDVEYEPYGAMPSIEYPSMPTVATGVQKINKIGKNHLNIPDAEFTQNGVSIKIKNNRITFNGTAESSYAFALAYNLKMQLKGIYTFSQNIASGSFSEGAYRFYLRQNTSVDLLEAPLTFTSVSKFATNEVDAVINQLGIYINKGNIFNNYIVELQVEKGDVVTSHEKPLEKETFELDLGTTELCKIVDGDGNIVAQDKSVYREVDGVWKWQWAKNVEKLVLDGTQTIETVATSDITTRVQFKNVIKATDINARTNSVCNMLKYKTIWSLDEEAYYFDNATLGIILRIRQEMIGTTKESVNEYFVNNNLVVYYPLTEPTYEDCTESQSAVLDELYKLSLEKGTNNIYVESENRVTAEMQLTYMQDLQMKHDNDIAEMKEAILELGGNV